MFDNQDLLNRLRSGTPAEELASELADMLNKAEDAYRAELEADRLAKEAEEAKSKNVNMHAQKVADAVNELFAVCFPEVETDPVSVQDVMEVIAMMNNIASIFKPIKNAKPIQKVKIIAQSADDVIADFLKGMGL